MKSASLIGSGRLAISALFLSMCVTFVPSPGLAQATRQTTLQKPDLRRLEAEAKTVGELVANRDSGEQELRDARHMLETQLEMLRSAPQAEDADAGGEEAKMQTVLVELIATITARLPTDVRSPLETTPPARARPFAVPAYDGSTVRGQRATELRQAYASLRDALTDSRAGRADRGPLLDAVTLAQQKLAWEAGWPFSPEEVDLMQAVRRSQAPEDHAKAFQEVYRLRIERGIAAVNRKMQQDASHVGRPTPAPYDILRSEDADTTSEAEIFAFIVDETGLSPARRSVRGFSSAGTSLFGEFEMWQLRRR